MSDPICLFNKYKGSKILYIPDGIILTMTHILINVGAHNPCFSYSCCFVTNFASISMINFLHLFCSKIYKNKNILLYQNVYPKKLPKNI